MSKSLRDKELLLVLSCELNTKPLSEGLGILAKVYRNLQNDHPSGGYGIAVHAVDWWYKLKNT